jgi:HPt (histidine-containing phosphotransfer) domain-containing protein
VALEEEFDSLRAEFNARLQCDRVQLTVFAAELARAEGDSTKLFERLRQFAHKTHGVAAIFQSLQVAEAARSLEQAAAAAASEHANGSDPSVWVALVALADVLAGMSPDHAGVSTGDAPT